MKAIGFPRLIPAAAAFVQSHQRPRGYRGKDTDSQAAEQLRVCRSPRKSPTGLSL